MSEGAAAKETANKGSTAEAPELEGIYAETPAADGDAEAGKEKGEAEAEPGKESQEQKTTGGEEGKDKGEEAEGPPESYEWNLPEGMELDQAGLEEFEPLAREWGLTQKQLDKGVEFYAGRMQQTVESVVDAMMAQAEEQSEALRKESEADKSIGKEGLQAAARAIERFGSDELREVLNESGLGNHPELVRFCQRVGQAIAEDRLEVGQGAGQQTPSDDGLDEGIYA